MDEKKVYKEILNHKTRGVEKKELAIKTNVKGPFLTKVIDLLIKKNLIKKVKSSKANTSKSNLLIGMTFTL